MVFIVHWMSNPSLYAENIAWSGRSDCNKDSPDVGILLRPNGFPQVPPHYTSPAYRKYAIDPMQIGMP